MAESPYRYNAPSRSGVPYQYDDPSRYELPPGYGGDDGWGATTSVHAGTDADTARPSPAGRAATDPAYAAPAPSALPPELDPRRGRAEWGLTGAAALVVLLVIAGIGALFDSLASIHGGFNIAIVVASIVAIAVVRRSAMFPIVVAPPIVYSAASAAMLYVRSDGLSDHKALYDAASNWLVYGFPAVAGATAAVLIIGGIRLVTSR